MKLKGIELKGTYKIIYYDTNFAVCDEKGNVIYLEDGNGHWSKSEYDGRDNRTYYKNNYGDWSKREYDRRDNLTYYEDNYGYWFKSEYDEKGNEIYFENSEGKIINKKVKELTIEQIEELLGYKIKIKGE